MCQQYGGEEYESRDLNVLEYVDAMIMNVPTVEEVEDLHESVEIVEEGEMSREEVVVIE